MLLYEENWRLKWGEGCKENDEDGKFVIVCE